MIIDINDSSVPASIKSKICVVGSGAIGLTFVSEFLNSTDVDIVLVESGGSSINSKLTSLDHVINTGDVESGVEGSRSRIFGGASTLWGGQVLPFSSLDFEQKSWVRNSGWPVEYQQLGQFYQRASKILNVDETDFSADIWEGSSSIKKQLNSQLLELGFSKWSPRPNLATVYKKPIEQAAHIRSLINANVMEVVLDASTRNVKKLNIKSLSGRQAEIEAEIFVLCCGGIDNARLLLVSRGVHDAGVGNQHGNVGRFYQDHIGIYGGRLIPKNFKAFQGMFSNVLAGKQKYLPKLELSRKLQMQKKLLNVTGNISIQADADSPMNNLKNFYKTLRSQGLNRSGVQSLIKAAKTPLELLRIIECYYLKHRKYFPKDAGFFLIANCESEPIEQSYIKLSSEVDVLGMPKAEVNWKLTQLSKKSLVVYYEAVRDELSRLGIADTIIQPVLYDSSDDWKQRCYSLYHHAGSTRMSENPVNGVVDAQCKVHGIGNLYVGGCSVFPTSSSSNPTFTAMALAIRLADHIKKATTF